MPTAPYRPPPSSGHRGLDKVLHVALAAKNWLKLQGLPCTSADLIALTQMALKAEREMADEAKRGAWEGANGIAPFAPERPPLADKPKPPAPPAGARRKPVAKKESTP